MVQGAWQRLRSRPELVLPAVVAWLRGWWYRLKFRLLGRRFRAGRLFRVYGPLYVSGPGRVDIGDDVLFIGDAIRPVCIRTFDRGAVVRLGDHSGLNGTSIQCVQSVSIGDLSNIADAYISDTPAHTLRRNRRELDVHGVAGAPVQIGRNVWISVNVTVLHGVSIGDNSVIGACSLVRKSVERDSFCAGNPLRRIGDIPE